MSPFIPSSQHPSVSLPPITFPSPPPTPLPEDLTEATTLINTWLNSINTAFKGASITSESALTSFFHPDCYWRDHLCLSWDFHTLHTPAHIHRFLSKHPSGCRVKSLALDSEKKNAVYIDTIDYDGEVKTVSAWLKVETDVGYGRGLVRLLPDGMAITLYTVLESLRGFEENVGGRRPSGVQHGSEKGRKSWKDRRIEEVELAGDNEPVVLIVGAGQSGLATAARLKMLGVKSLIIDKNERVGDNWRKRYHQLVIHDPVWFDHLPYIPFPSTWPVFTPKDKLGDWFESYASALELNIWLSTTISSSTWDEAAGKWSITLTRNIPGGKESEREIHPAHIVMATGHSGEPYMPMFPGMSSFKGETLCHSASFPGANPNKWGKKAVVVGCCNSGHDIAQDFYEKGYDVTIVQRSSTYVMSSDAGLNALLGNLYYEGGPPAEDSDILFLSLPSAIAKTNHIKMTQSTFDHDYTTNTALTKAGFNLDLGPHGSGFMFKYLERGGGYYLDVGCSSLIGSGAIAVKQGVEISSITPTGLNFADGTSLDADEIVLATGYKSMVSTAAKILGEENVKGVGEIWGTNGEGEIRGVWRRSGKKGLWFMGGNLMLTRYFSRMLALEIKALEEGIMSWDAV